DQNASQEAGAVQRVRVHLARGPRHRPASHCGSRWQTSGQAGAIMPRVGMGPIRREQIRRAAMTLIADAGFDRTTLRDVALVAGVSTGMINHYYPNKIALLMDALVGASEWFQEEIRVG